MDGSISVTSEVGKGSDFAFEIPATGATEGPQMRGNVLAGRRAVILSKNAVEAEALAMTIRAHGGNVDIAATVAQATAMSDGCATLLVDAAMEQSDGRVLRRLRQSGDFSSAEAITLIAPTDRGMLGEYPRERLYDLPCEAGAGRNPAAGPAVGARRPANTGRPG